MPCPLAAVLRAQKVSPATSRHGDPAKNFSTARAHYWRLSLPATLQLLDYSCRSAGEVTGLQTIVTKKGITITFLFSMICGKASRIGSPIMRAKCMETFKLFLRIEFSSLQVVTAGDSLSTLPMFPFEMTTPVRR